MNQLIKFSREAFAKSLDPAKPAELLLVTASVIVLTSVDRTMHHLR